MAVRERVCQTYESQEMERSELLDLPPRVDLPKENATIHNFSTPDQAIRFINANKNKDWRVEMWVHDSNTDLNTRLFYYDPEHHVRGIGIGHLAVHAKPGFSRWLRKQSSTRELGPLDFYQIRDCTIVCVCGRIRRTEQFVGGSHEYSTRTDR